VSRTLYRILILAAITGAALSATLVAGAAPILDATHIKDATLDNGLHVVVKEEPAAPVVSLALMIRVGPLYETERTKGASHFVEHLLFEGDAGPDERKLGPIIEGLGGQVNASTTRDCTTVTVTITPENLDTVLALLARAAFGSKFTEKQVTDQRQIIKREIQDRNVSADDALDRLIWATAFTKHPYGYPIGGDADSIGKFTPESLQVFYNQFYVPNNMAIIACGNVKADAFTAQVKQVFGKFFRKDLKLTLPPTEPPPGTPRVKVEPRYNPATLITYAFQAPSIENKRDVCAMDLIYTLLGEGENCLLRQKLEIEKQLVKGSSVDFITHRMPGLIIITTVVDPRQELPARQALLDVVSSLAKAPPTAEQLARAKKLIYVSYAFQNEACSDQVGSMGFYEAIDTYRFAVDYIDEVNKVTPEDVQRVAQQHLTADSSALVVLRSEKPAAPGQEARLP
jgi:zinc protease